MWIRQEAERRAPRFDGLTESIHVRSKSIGNSQWEGLDRAASSPKRSRVLGERRHCEQARLGRVRTEDGAKQRGGPGGDGETLRCHTYMTSQRHSQLRVPRIGIPRQEAPIDSFSSKPRDDAARGPCGVDACAEVEQRVDGNFVL